MPFYPSVSDNQALLISCTNFFERSAPFKKFIPKLSNANNQDSLRWGAKTFRLCSLLSSGPPVFSDAEASQEQVWTPLHTPDEFPSISSGIEEYSGRDHNTKTNIVVPVVGVIVVAIGRPTIPRIVVPRPAAFVLPVPLQEYAFCARIR